MTDFLISQIEAVGTAIAVTGSSTELTIEVVPTETPIIGKMKKHAMMLDRLVWFSMSVLS